MSFVQESKNKNQWFWDVYIGDSFEDPQIDIQWGWGLDQTASTYPPCGDAKKKEQEVIALFQKIADTPALCTHQFYDACVISLTQESHKKRGLNVPQFLEILNHQMSLYLAKQN